MAVNNCWWYFGREQTSLMVVSWCGEGPIGFEGYLGERFLGGGGLGDGFLVVFCFMVICCG